MISKVRFRKRETDQEDSTDKPPYTYKQKIYLIDKDIRIKPGKRKLRFICYQFYRIEGGGVKSEKY